MNHSLRIAASIAFLYLLMFHVSAHAVELAVFLKGGGVFLGHSSQTLEDNVTRDFDSPSDHTYAAAWELRTPVRKDGRHHLAGGMEYVRYYFNFTPAAGDSEADASILVANAKYYYTPAGSAFHPFFGFGIGHGRTHVSSAVYNSGNRIDDDSTARQFTGGVEYRPKNFGLYAEVKYIRNYSDDDESRDFHASGYGVFLGVTWQLAGP